MTSYFVNTASSVCLKDVESNGYSFSPSQYRTLNLKNKNVRTIRDFLDRNLIRADLGEEVGSASYIGESPYKFIKTKALQPHSFIPEINGESVVPIMPSAFRDMHLRKGDLILSKDSNIGEAVILEKDYLNASLSGAIYRLPVSTNKYYLFAFIKHPLFREQIDFLTPKGATIRHCKTLFLDCKIPLPNYRQTETIRYVEDLVKAIVDKQARIVGRHQAILSKISFELEKNQGPNEFHYELPRLSDVDQVGRLDSKMYTEEFKREVFKISNYVGGCSTIDELGFSLSRGQNLQVSNIGDSVYSEEYHDGFYALMLPKFISKFGTCDKVVYLGNPNELKTLKVGDLIFGAEGFEKGRSTVVIETRANAITNIHGITMQQPCNGELDKAIFVKCFLDYLRSRGLIDMFAVGGNGGSMAQKYWNCVPFPNFKRATRKEIVTLYFNGKIEYAPQKMSLEEFEVYDKEYNVDAGIYELDKSTQFLKRKLSEAIFSIANDVPVRPFFMK